MGSGGARIAAGRKPIDDAGARVTGSRRRGRTWVPASSSSDAAEVTDVKMPADLSPAEREVWVEWAPHALAARTLVPATAGAFRDLCEATALKREILASIRADGLLADQVIVDRGGQERRDRKAHPLLGALNRVMQRTEAAWTRFKLAPIGREMVAPSTATALSPLQRLQGQIHTFRKASHEPSA